MTKSTNRVARDNASNRVETCYLSGVSPTRRGSTALALAVSLASVASLALTGCSDEESGPYAVPVVSPTLYVAHEGSFAAFDVATGARVGTPFDGVSKPYGMQVLTDGTVLVHLTDDGMLLAANGATGVEEARVPTSAMGATRPVDSFLSPDLGGSEYWISLNDGTSAGGDSSMSITDVTPGSPTRLQHLGEIASGNGHHQGAFSATLPRFVVTSFFDCDAAIQVIDFSDPTSPKELARFSAADLGFDGATLETTCDPAESAGIALRPHGCATSKANGKTYCNLSGPGLIAVIDTDATPPTVKTIPTSAKGGGYVKSGEGGEYVYTVQNEPREGAGGAACQVGQLLTIETATDTIVHEMPLFYKGPDCTEALAGTDEETAGQNHIRITSDGATMFIALAGGFGVDDARIRQHEVVDLSDPSAPVQLPSIAVGTSSAQRGSAISGDGQFLYVANTLDDSVSQIDIASLTVSATIPVSDAPYQVATFGSVEGPSLHLGPVH